MTSRCSKTAIAFILATACIAGSGIFLCPASAAPADIISISGNQYYSTVKESLQNAKISVDLVMYLITFDPNASKSQVNDLVQELINAHKRGVKVKVVLDQNIDFARWNEGKDWEKEDKNEAVFAYLKDQGVDVYFDNLYVVTHAKALVIDGETVIFGSANWTETSLSKNTEISSLVRSKEFALQVLDEFSKITIDHEASIIDKERKPPVRLNEVFLTDRSLAPALFSVYYDLAFELYLFLLKQYDGNPEGLVGIDYNICYETFFPDKNKGYEYARTRLIRALRRLEKLKLIGIQLRTPRSPLIFLKDYPRNLPYVVPKKKYCSIPDEFWRYGWNHRLSFPEKYCYLINLSRSGSARGQRWSAFRDQLFREYKISVSSLIHGMKGLRIKNIIEIDYPPYSNVFPFHQEVKPTRFTLLGLYSPDQLKQDKDKLAVQYGEDLFTKAQSYAELVYKGNDVQVIEDIIRKIEAYGIKEVDYAFKVVAKKAYNNPKRSYKYLIGVIQERAATQQ